MNSARFMSVAYANKRDRVCRYEKCI